MTKSKTNNNNICDRVLSLIWYLCAVWADPVQSSGGAVQETNDLQEVVVTDTPGSVDQEDQVCFGCLTDWTDRERQRKMVRRGKIQPACARSRDDERKKAKWMETKRRE